MRDVRALSGASSRRDAGRDAGRDGGRDGGRRLLGVRAATPLGTPRAEAHARRSQPPSGRRPRGPRVWLLLGLVAGLSAAAVVGAGELLSRADALPVRTLAVRGADGVLADEVRAYAALSLGSPVFSVNLDDVAARVMEHPYVRSAEVRRVPPDAIEISVRLRTATALVPAGPLYLVDELGAVFKSARAGDGLDLPLITGLEEQDVQSGAATGAIATALALLRAHGVAATPGGEVSEVHVETDGSFALVLAGGARVHLGRIESADGTADPRMGEKLARLAVIMERLQGAGQQASSIRLDDERRPERAAVRLRAGTETPPHGG